MLRNGLHPTLERRGEITLQRVRNWPEGKFLLAGYKTKKSSCIIKPEQCNLFQGHCLCIQLTGQWGLILHCGIIAVMQIRNKCNKNTTKGRRITPVLKLIRLIMQGVISGKEIKLLKQNTASFDAENTPYYPHGSFAWVGNVGLRLWVNTDSLCYIAGKV